jgi:hypothetical protein
MKGGRFMSCEQCILTLATEQFPNLTDAEKELVRAVSAGAIADYSEMTEYRE